MCRSLLAFLVQQTLIVSLAILGNSSGYAGKVRGNAAAAPPTYSDSGADLEAVPLQTQQPPLTDTAPPASLSRKQKKELLKSNAEKMKQDSDELVALAKSLQEDVNAYSSENVLSLKIVDEAEKIEKLARKIKNRARGN